MVGRGQWCPTCNKGSKSEELARVAFQHAFHASFPKKRPKWLRNDRGRQMELDGFAEELGIAVINSRRIAGCDSCARSKAGQSRLLGIGNLDSFARSFGGECLSKEYFGRKHKYEWHCKAGHVFLGDFNNTSFARNSALSATKPRTEASRSVTHPSHRHLQIGIR